MRFDAVIVGAGPAGCLAARELARSGARVALVDDSHPREKPCGGGVTQRAMSLITSDACMAASGGRPIESVVFEAGGLNASVALPQLDVLRVFPRASFDAALLSEATTSGALHVAARATDVERDERGWTIHTRRGKLAGSWLLGADGPSGLVRPRVFRRFRRHQLSIAAGCFVEGATTSEVVIGFVNRPRGYLWSFPRRDHIAVGACAQADQTSSTDLQRVAHCWLDHYPLAAERTRRRYAWPIPSLSAADLDAERPSGDRWMLLGDAAGLVDPITREGIFFALHSGILAAHALHDAAPSGAYSAAVRDAIHPELKRAARLRDAVFRPRFTTLLLQALMRSASIRSVMVDLIRGTQTYAGLKRRLLGTFELGLMWQLFVTSPQRLSTDDYRLTTID